MELWILWVLRVFRLLFGIQMIEIAVKQVEPVQRGEELIAIAEMILANLRRGVSMELQQLGDGRVCILQSLFRARQADFQQTRAERMLAGYELARPAVQLCWHSNL
jgi:hypothetical protein